MSEKITGNDTQYPALSEMGIIRFHEISHYSLRQDGPDKDVLRVIYNRAKGSLLPYSRKYKFGRAMQTVVADGGSSRMEQTHVISPFLLKAVSELDKLVSINQHDSSKSSSTDLKSDLMVEIEELKQLVNESIPADSLARIQTKIDNLGKHIDAL